MSNFFKDEQNCTCLFVQFVVFEKKLQVLFVQIACCDFINNIHKKIVPNCMRKIMWLLINNIHKKIEMVMQEECKHITRKLCHPRLAFGYLTLQIDQWFITSFCTVLPENCISLSQSEWSNFFVYIDHYLKNVFAFQNPGWIFVSLNTKPLLHVNKNNVQIFKT